MNGAIGHLVMQIKDLYFRGVLDFDEPKDLIIIVHYCLGHRQISLLYCSFGFWVGGILFFFKVVVKFEFRVLDVGAW